MNALELLRTDHETVRGLFSTFSQAKEAGDVAQMGALQRTIFSELETHAAIEEEVFYPEAEQIGGEAQDLVNEGIEEHHVVKVLMGEIAALSPDDDAWVAKMTVLIENVEHHAEEEEDELFPQLREAFGDERLERMGAALAEAKQRRASGAAGEGSAQAAASGDEPTRDQLYEQAKEQDVAGRSTMTKDELAEAVDSDG